MEIGQKGMWEEGGGGWGEEKETKGRKTTTVVFQPYGTRKSWRGKAAKGWKHGKEALGLVELGWPRGAWSAAPS